MMNTNMKSLLVNILERSTDTFWSWIVCFSSFLIQLLVCGVHNSFGTIFVALLNKFGRSESETVWVGAAAVGLTYFCGPLSTYLCHRFGCRIIACTGSVLLAISGFLTSYVRDISWMYLTFGVLNGLASSMLYFSSLVALIEYFYQHLPTASGISVSGSGVGTVTMTILLQHLISRYGLKITFQVVAGMSAICFVAGLTYAPLESSKEKSFKESFHNLPLMSLEKKDIKSGRKKTFLIKCLRSLKLGKHWKNKGFIAWTVSMMFIMFVCYVPLMYLVRLAEDVGVPPSKGGFLISIFAIFSTVGKIAFGRLANLKYANRLRMAQMSLFFMAVATCLLPLAKSYSALIAYSAVQGFFDGSFIVLIGLITNDIVGKELMAGAVAGVYFVISFPMTIGPPVAGMFYDHFGNYHAVFFLSGALTIAGMFIMFLIPWLTPPMLQKPDCFKQDLTPMKNKPIGGSRYGNRYDLSCVDEKHLADLFGESGADRLLGRNRSFLDGNSTNSQRSSFVLFTIVSDENQRDISAYSSYQDLALNNDTTPNFSSSLKKYFGSHSSLFSQTHSILEAPHLESIPEIVSTRCDMEHQVLIHRDANLGTVSESGEIVNDSFLAVEEKTEKDILQNKTVIGGLNKNDIDKNHEGIMAQEKEAFCDDNSLGVVDEDDVASSLSVSSSSLSCDPKKSSSRLSTGTADSGFDDCKIDSLTDEYDTGSRGSLAEKSSLSKDDSAHLCSCSDVSVLSEARDVLSSYSQDSIDSCKSQMEDYYD